MHPTDRSEVDGLFSDSDLTTLVDLQKYLAEELSHGAENGVDLTRAFTPLTDGLGIHGTPGKKSQAVGATKAGQATFATPAPEQMTEYRTSTATPKDNVRPATRLIIDAGLDTRPISQQDLAATPPPVPAATFGRRLLAGFVDQIFVLGAWAVTLFITSNAMLGSGPGDLGTRFVQQFNNAAFQRAAALEFGMIWLGYLTLSFAILEMSFGMWVWGLRINYGTQDRGWKKLARVVLGMFVYPAIVPTLILAVRKQGKTLIDSLTQSSVYRIAQN